MLKHLSLRILTSWVVLLAIAAVPQIKQVQPAAAQSTDLGGSSPTNRVAIVSVVPGDRSLTVGWSISALESSAEIRYRVKDAFPTVPSVTPGVWTTTTLSGAGLSSAFVARSLINGVTYEIQMRSFRERNDYSPWSNTASATPNNPTPVEAAVALQALSVEQSTGGVAFDNLVPPLSPSFSANYTAYYGIVSGPVAHVRLTPVTAAVGATVEISKGATEIATIQTGFSTDVTLDPGPNTITLSPKIWHKATSV